MPLMPPPTTRIVPDTGVPPVTSAMSFLHYSLQINNLYIQAMPFSFAFVMPVQEKTLPESLSHIHLLQGQRSFLNLQFHSLYCIVPGRGLLPGTTGQHKTRITS